MKIDDGGPAFPVAGNVWCRGMSLRDYIAAQALPAIIGNATAKDKLSIIAKIAYAAADAMIAESMKGNEQ